VEQSDAEDLRTSGYAEMATGRALVDRVEFIRIHAIVQFPNPSAFSQDFAVLILQPSGMKEKMNLILSIEASPDPRHKLCRIASELRINGFNLGAAAATPTIALTSSRIGASSGDGPDIHRGPEERLSARDGHEGGEAEIMAMEIESMDDICVDEIRV